MKREKETENEVEEKKLLWHSQFIHNTIRYEVKMNYEWTANRICGGLFVCFTERKEDRKSERERVSEWVSSCGIVQNQGKKKSHTKKNRNESEW